MFNLIIRAVTDKGKAFDLEQIRIDAALTFTMIYKCAQEKEAFPDVSWIPNVWKNELYPEFIKREGIIVAFLMIKLKGSEEETLNCMYFKVDDEGRRELKLINKNIIQASGVLTKSIPNIQGHLQQHEMIHEKFKDLVVRKDRVNKDDLGVYVFDTAPEFNESIEPRIIDLAPEFKNDSGWYSEQEGLNRTLYRIYINGKMSTLVVDDISFMKQIHENSANGLFSVLDIHGRMEMTQSLFDILNKFLRDRDFKIGAHPEGEILEDGNDAVHSIFWGQEEKEVLYISPLASTYDFD